MGRGILRHGKRPRRDARWRSDKATARDRGYKRYARELKLDLARFEKDLADPESRKRIDADTAEALALGVTGTPGFFVNGRFLSGAQPFEEFATAIDAELRRVNLPVPAGAPAS